MWTAKCNSVMRLVKMTAGPTTILATYQIWKEYFLKFLQLKISREHGEYIQHFGLSNRRCDVEVVARSSLSVPTKDLRDLTPACPK